MRRVGRCKNGDESTEGEVHVEGAAKWRGLFAGRAKATVLQVVAAGVRRDPTSPARLARASEMASAPRWRTALKQSWPLKPLHRPLQAACGWLHQKGEYCIASLEPPWRRPSGHKLCRPFMPLQWTGVVPFLSSLDSGR